MDPDWLRILAGGSLTAVFVFAIQAAKLPAGIRKLKADTSGVAVKNADQAVKVMAKVVDELQDQRRADTERFEALRKEDAARYATLQKQVDEQQRYLALLVTTLQTNGVQVPPR